ncbi:Bpu10I family restriction endonuclease [Citrobacter sp. Cf098]|uniref:Bpu10I family restriction endonuclease n=1 Tax=Citrobacter sp. Cf098 TaxID=2985060 RepID=UPI0025759EB0|nr:Bpu10I family restriction endonuclease [Citrobacter sp. Cf098]MDM3184362.1 Bpu10I family restriction endonuclease [Citrobacter sp. Cf098]
MRVERPHTHGNKLRALLGNANLPAGDIPRVQEAIEKYDEWRTDLTECDADGDELLMFFTQKLNEYKNFIDLELIFNSNDNFLYRQNGQLKLSNSIMEEFLPYIFDVRLVPGFNVIEQLICGPQSSFAGLSFGSPILSLSNGGVFIKRKDQDFAVAKKHKITISNVPGNTEVFSANFCVSHFATEIKTNLDKTMFQEASQTANELKLAVPGSRYLLLCEYLDMKPITTKLTSIDEVIVLRKAKRLSSNIRSAFSTSAGRRAARAQYSNFLERNPFHFESFQRFIHHLNDCFPASYSEDTDAILNRGYF